MEHFSFNQPRLRAGISSVHQCKALCKCINTQIVLNFIVSNIEMQLDAHFTICVFGKMQHARAKQLSQGKCAQN